MNVNPYDAVVTKKHYVGTLILAAAIDYNFCWVHIYVNKITGAAIVHFNYLGTPRVVKVHFRMIETLSGCNYTYTRSLFPKVQCKMFVRPYCVHLQEIGLERPKGVY